MPIKGQKTTSNGEEGKPNFRHNLNKKICKLHATITTWWLGWEMAGNSQIFIHL